jgi:hypothetical protein
MQTPLGIITLAFCFEPMTHGELMTAVAVESKKELGLVQVLVDHNSTWNKTGKAELVEIHDQRRRKHPLTRPRTVDPASCFFLVFAKNCEDPRMRRRKGVTYDAMTIANANQLAINDAAHFQTAEILTYHQRQKDDFQQAEG